MSNTAPPEQARSVLSFWLETVGPSGWYRVDPSVDEACRSRFGQLVEEAIAGNLSSWENSREGALALLLLLDQFPRNIYRDSARAFAGDPLGRAIAERAIANGYDRGTPEPERSFFYLPFEHSEALADQDRAVALFEERMPGSAENIRHAHLHRDLIVKFGRFPHRNAVLGRANTPEEDAHLGGGGYQPGSTPTKG